MKNTSRIFFYLISGILLAACGQFMLPPTPIDLAAVKTSAAATVFVELTEKAARTATPSITPSVTMTATITATPTTTIDPTPSQTARPIPTLFPALDPTAIPGLLQSKLSVETVVSFNGHNLQRVTGWSYGFDGFGWMDTKHLLLYPIVDQEMMEMSGKVAASYPAVINLDSKKVWLPPAKEPVRKYGTYGGPILPHWSAQLGVLLASESDTSTGIYGPDGDLLETYEGNLIGVSPSATKILISTLFVDSTWVDLRNGNKVIFPWKNNRRQMDDLYIRPIWSPDEMRVYAGYHIYVDAKTREIFEMSGTTVDGEKTDLLFDHFYGTWVLGGTYMLPQWHGLYDGTPGFLALFDPAAKTYRNLSALAGIPYDLNKLSQSHPCNNYSASTTTGGRFVWLDCVDGGRLIDLATFKSQTYPDYLEAHLYWSADGNFAWVTRHSDGIPKILSGSSKELKPIPADPKYSIWHPTNNILAYLSNKGQTLSLMDARSMSIQKEVALPVAFRELVWSPNGNHLALVAEDNSLWQIDYPTLKNLEQLSPAMLRAKQPDITNVVWSLDGTSLAFISDKDIYTVNAK